MCAGDSKAGVWKEQQSARNHCAISPGPSFIFIKTKFMTFVLKLKSEVTNIVTNSSNNALSQIPPSISLSYHSLVFTSTLHFIVTPIFCLQCCSTV